MTETHDALSRIRDAEMEAADRISRAVEAAEERIAAAHLAAQRLVEDARAAGAAEANAAFDRVVADARLRAEAIAAERQGDAGTLRAAVEPRLPGLAEEMLERILPESSTPEE